MIYLIPSPSSRVFVHFYVDDSNIAIGGRDVYEIYKHNNPEVPRKKIWNYDINRLSEKIMRELRKEHDWDVTPDRLHKRFNFYGGTLRLNPHLNLLREKGHPNMTFFDCEFNIEGKEKQGDTELSVRMTDCVKDAYYFRQAAYFVVLSGDADMIPVIKETAGLGFTVHVWSWEHCLSNALKALEEDPDCLGLVKVREIDDLEEITLDETRTSLDD